MNHLNALSPEMLLFVRNLVELVESLDGMDREDILAVSESQRLVSNHPRQVLLGFEIGTRLAAAGEADGLKVLLEEFSYFVNSAALFYF